MAVGQRAMRKMARKRIKVTRRMLFTWFMLAGLIFLFAPQSLTNKFQLGFARLFRWPLGFGRNVSLLAQPQSRTDAVSRREFERLQNQLHNVTKQLYEEHQKVVALSGLRDRLGLEGAAMVRANVIQASTDPGQSKLIINRGKNDGLSTGQFVLDGSGVSVIGTISYVDDRTCQVTLVTDSTSRIAVKIANLDIDRVMQGTGNNSAKVNLVPTKNKVRPGDIIYTCKKPGLLDVPMVIAKVAQCKRDDENPLSWDITAEPVCDVERLTDVAVIVMNPRK